MQLLRRLILFVLAAPLLASCSDAGDSVLATAVIATEDELLADGLRLSPAAQHLRGAVAAGLVARDPQGEIVPALAESWLVTDDGLSYIFRLRELQAPDGSAITAEQVRQSLLRSRIALRGTSLGLDLAPIAEVRAMTGRVLELRLSTPVPDMLMLLAQPELAIRKDGAWLGEMELVEAAPGPANADQAQESSVLTLRLRPPLERGQPESEDWAEFARDITIEAVDGTRATERFYDGDFDLVLGGGVGHMPLVNTGPLTRGTARVDPAIGLFGLLAMREEGALASDTMREALAMAIDRQELLSRFTVGGWVPTTRLVAPGLPNDSGRIAERWIGESIEERRARAGLRLEAASDRTLSLALGNGPGHDIIFDELARQLAIVGITLERAGDADDADLVLVDRVARYADARWFLNQFHCSLRRGLCNAEVDTLVAAALAERDAAQRAVMMAEAEATLTLDNIFIPLGQPLRWSLARGYVEPFEPNPWAFHPLPELAVIPR